MSGGEAAEMALALARHAARVETADTSTRRSSHIVPAPGTVLPQASLAGGTQTPMRAKAGRPGSAFLSASRVPLVIQAKLTINEPGDEYEREADRVAEAVMRSPELDLQCPCACGGKCSDCKSGHGNHEPERLQIGQVASGRPSARQAPPLVHEVVASPGQPLDRAAREFLEPRFGHDFSRVRVHTDGAAAESARAVNASAYTVGHHMVFRDGAHALRTAEGTRLLAHELAHVVQQRAASVPALGRASGRLQRQADGGSEQLTDKPQAKCGPDVTKQLKDAQIKTRKQFDKWNSSRKESACQDLVSLIFGPIAWDIIDLNESDWILANYGPTCATTETNPSCIKSVQIDNECFYAGSVNYVHFGNMFDLCQNYYASAYPLNKQFTQNEMLGWINFYKGTGMTGWRTPDKNFQSSIDWATAGYFNWPHGALTPKGDRPNCSPTCSLPYAGGDFRVNWSGENY
jgi:hypothetical protein